MRMGRGDSGGTISLEMAVLAIPLIMLLMLMWAFGVYAQAESISDQAARDAQALPRVRSVEPLGDCESAVRSDDRSRARR